MCLITYWITYCDSCACPKSYGALKVPVGKSQVTDPLKVLIIPVSDEIMINTVAKAEKVSDEVDDDLDEEEKEVNGLNPPTETVAHVF